MKFRVLGTALLLTMTAAVYGQPRFDVPFAFRIGDKSLAAGTYSVSTEGTMSPLLIRSEAGQSIMLLPQCGVQAPSAPSAGKLVFHRYGNTYFLSQVWRGGADVGSQLRESRAEREIAKAGAFTQVTSAVYASLR